MPLLLACALPLCAHPQGSTADTVYRLHGRVLNGVSKKPLARALVTSADRRLAVMTGNEGQFSIDISIPPRPAAAGPPRSLGIYTSMLSLLAQKPGYIAPQIPEVFPLDDTLPSRDIVLKLMPASVIAGHVSATTKDAVPNLRVTLLFRQAEDGDLIWRLASSQITNSRGEFHFANLRPGEYTLMCAQWRGDQPPPTQTQTSAVTEQFPAVFLGDTSTLNAAAKVHLAYGDTIQADVHLHPASFYPVTIPLAASSGAVNARLGSSQIFTGYRFAYNPRAGAVEGALPSGNYEVTLNGRGGDPNAPPTSALLSLHVAGAPLQTPPVVLVPPTTIEVQVHEEFTQPETAQNSSRAQLRSFSQSGGAGQPPQTFPLVHIFLRSADDGSGSNLASTPKPGRSDQLALNNVPPGRYFVRAAPMRGYVASLSAGGIDLSEKPLVITPGGSPAPLEVTLRDDTATVTGMVSLGSAPTAVRSFIVFLPADAKGRFTQAFAPLDGKFSVSLPPGSYRVMAFQDQPPQLHYRDHEAMRRYDGKGITVTAAAGQTLQIDVPVLDAAAFEVP